MVRGRASTPFDSTESAFNEPSRASELLFSPRLILRKSRPPFKMNMADQGSIGHRR